MIGAIGRVLMQAPESGARPTLFAATRDLPGGSFVQPGGFGHLRGEPVISMASSAAYDVTVAGALWDLSERLTLDTSVGQR